MLGRLPPLARPVAIAFVFLIAAAPAVWPPLTPFKTDRIGKIKQERLFWRDLAERIQETESDGGRVMFENYNLFYAEQDPIPDRITIYAPMLLPAMTGRPFLGGHYPNIFLKQNIVNFYSGMLAGRPIDQWSKTKLTEFLDAYFVDLIVVHSSAAKSYFKNAFPEAELVWILEDFAAYRYRPSGGFFATGSGSVSFDYGKIALSDLVAAEDGSVVLKCHYVDGLRSSDGSIVRPTTIPGALLPVIELRPKSSSVSLSL